MSKATFALGILSLILASCNQVQNTWGTLMESDGTQDLITLSQNQPFTYQDLQMAFGNCWNDDYTDEQNQPQNGLRCAIWWWSQTIPYSHQRVYPGQEITIGDYHVRVNQVQATPQGSFTMQIGIKTLE